MIWCIEDDASVRDIEVYTLNQTGLDARGFEDGETFFEALKAEKPDLVILDLMLPGDDGVEILTRLRKNPDTENIPIIMATARGTEYDKVRSLDLGADDYLVKPFGMMEMVSRVKAVLRRCGGIQSAGVIDFGEIRMNTEERTATVSGKEINLTFKEYELLRQFLLNPGIAFSREQLFSKVWGDDYMGESRTLDMHIRTLRQKLGDCSEYIKTVRNIGYRLEKRK